MSSKKIKIDCYILRIRARGVWFSWVFLCKLNPSEITEKEIAKGVEAYLEGAALAVDEIEEIKVDKKTLEINMPLG